MMEPIEAILFHLEERDRWDQSWAESEAVLDDGKAVEAYHRPRVARHSDEIERLRQDWPAEYDQAIERLQAKYEAEA